jgi:hypothetical protein
MNSREFLHQGKCECCGTGLLAHGPWTDAQIAEVENDLGLDAGELDDCCDDCFVEDVANGNVAYAQVLHGKVPLKLAKPEFLAQQALLT